MMSLSLHGLLICLSPSFVPCLHSAFADMNYHFVFSLSTFCMLIKQKSLFRSAGLNHFMRPCVDIVFNHFFLSLFFFCMFVYISSPHRLLITFLLIFSLPPYAPFYVPLPLKYKHAWNLNICSSNANLSLVIWLLCWWRRGGKFPVKRWKGRTRPVNIPKTCLSVTKSLWRRSVSCQSLIMTHLEPL